MYLSVYMLVNVCHCVCVCVCVRVWVCVCARARATKIPNGLIKQKSILVFISKHGFIY